LTGKGVPYRRFSHGWGWDPCNAFAKAVAARIKDAGFPVEKDFDAYDFSVMPQLSKPKILELARCEWIEQKYNCCLVGNQVVSQAN
jgi:DNA replication protein DnaC